MNLYTPEWRLARTQLQEPIAKYLQSSEMGSFVYFKEPRGVTIKHRMRKDQVAVISLGCWIKSESEDKSQPLFFKTIAFPADPAALGKALEEYLLSGALLDPASFSTFPGYEDFDSFVISDLRN